jgi:predicted MarR family transcription regulator
MPTISNTSWQFKKNLSRRSRCLTFHDQCLRDGLKVLGLIDAVLKELAQFLRKMSGLYDQAARAAASL